MATLEDRLLGEKLHYYCSSSEEEDNNDDKQEDEGFKDSNLGNAPMPAPPPQKWEGNSCNTGPKGVLKDWQRFKQLETEQRREQEREKIALAKKLQLSCRSHLDDEKAEEEEDVDKLIDDEILNQYIMKRMQEMIQTTTTKKKFGQLVHLETSEAYLEAIEKEDKDVTVVIHVFDEKVPGCQTLNGCLLTVVQNYSDVKFCCIRARTAKLSHKFQLTGLPAILVYKNGQMVGNFIRITDDLGEDFYSSDVESFLIEHGILCEKTQADCKRKIRDSSRVNDMDSDSD